MSAAAYGKILLGLFIIFSCIMRIHDIANVAAILNV